MSERQRAALPTITLDRARELRGAATDVENEIWYHLRGSGMNGVKFRRQHPIPPYVVDFYCDARKLVVELDGSQHGEERDSVRAQFLMKRGLTILRFTNHDVLQHKQAVLDAIWSAVADPPLTPTPLPTGEGL